MEREPFAPRFPWLGGDLQTLRNTLLRHRPCLDRWPHARLVLALDDGSGDALQAALHQPTEPAAHPLMVLVHGLTGDETSSHVCTTARVLLEHGYPVLRLNLRGAGPSRQTCRNLYHAGRSEDLAAALAALPDAITRHGVVVVGFSLGGNLLLKYLGERGSSVPLVAAVAISAPIDLAATARRLGRPRNRIYAKWLVTNMKMEALAPGLDLTDGERAVIAGARNIIEFDNGFMAPHHGFAGVDDYYRRNSVVGVMAEIRVPTLVIHALNDPWIAPEPYLRFDWSRAPALHALITRGGGHVGFHGRGHLAPWHDRSILAFLEALRA